MKTIAVILFTIILISFWMIQSFVLKYLYSNRIEQAKKLSWISLIVMLIGTYAVLAFIPNYLNQDSFSSDLNEIQNAIFIVYLAFMLFYQFFESYRLRKIDGKIGIVSYIPFISRAISILFMLGYLAIYTLP